MTSPLAQAIALQQAVKPAQTGVAPTDVVGAYKLASDVAEKNYQAKLQAQMGMWGGLAALGSAGLIGGKSLWAPALSKALGMGSTPAAGTAGAAAPAVTSGVDAATGAPVAASSTSWAAPAAADTGTVAADLGTTAPEAGTVAADLSGAAGADAAGSLAADLGAGGAGTAMADLGASTAPDWLASILPFLA